MAAPRKGKKIYHHHGCRQCRTKYGDACDTPAEDRLCTACRGGRPWVLLIKNAHPQDCCIATAQLVTKDEKRRYDLAGSCPWFICQVCRRTHPYDCKRFQPELPEEPK